MICDCCGKRPTASADDILCATCKPVRVEVVVSDHEREVMRRAAGEGIHYQLVASHLLDRLLERGAVIVGRDLLCRTPGQHAAVYGAKVAS